MESQSKLFRRLNLHWKSLRFSNSRSHVPCSKWFKAKFRLSAFHDIVNFAEGQWPLLSSILESDSYSACHLKEWHMWTVNNVRKNMSKTFSISVHASVCVCVWESLVAWTPVFQRQHNTLPCVCVRVCWTFFCALRFEVVLFLKLSVMLACASEQARSCGDTLQCFCRHKNRRCGTVGEQARPGLVGGSNVVVTWVWLGRLVILDKQLVKRGYN